MNAHDLMLRLAEAEEQRDYYMRKCAVRQRDSRWWQMMHDTVGVFFDAHKRANARRSP